jgi:hypothetical protein
MSKLQQKPSALKREHPALKKMKFVNFLDPDPGTPLNLDPQPESFNHSGPPKSVPPNFPRPTTTTPHLIGVRNNIARLLPVVPAGGAPRRLVVGVAESAAVVRAPRRRRLSLVVVRLPPLFKHQSVLWNRTVTFCRVEPEP